MQSHDCVDFGRENTTPVKVVFISIQSPGPLITRIQNSRSYCCYHSKFGHDIYSVDSLHADFFKWSVYICYVLYDSSTLVQRESGIPAPYKTRNWSFVFFINIIIIITFIGWPADTRSLCISSKDTDPLRTEKLHISKCIGLTHLALVPHICVNESGHHWFR